MATTNMTHPPQEVLLKVMCSERLPIQAARYLAQSEFSLRTRIFNGESFLNSQSVPVIAWYEPATRIVLTEEELQDLLSDARSEGYGDGSVEGSSNR